MSDAKKNELVPKLRFPEFDKDKEWQLTTIGEVGKFYYGKSAPKWSLSDDAPTPCVRYGELYTKFDTLISKIYSRTNIDPTNLRFSKGGEILVPRVGEVPQEFAKHCCYLPFSDIAIGEMISVYETEEYPIFYAYYFRTLWKEFAEVVEGQNVKNLYYVNLEPIAVGKPSFKEQQKIADCLSSLDEVTTFESQKLEVLKEHKKGLLQNLFPQEGETLPKLRFKEFADSGEWEDKVLGEIGKITSGGTPNRSMSEFWNGDIPWISTTLIDFNIINEAKEYITELGLQSSSAKIFPKNTILMAMYGQGKTRGKVAILGIQAATNQACAAIILDENQNTNFVFQYLSANYEGIRRMSNSGGQENLSGGLIEIIPIPLPKNPKEQQKIAACLTSLDNLIHAQNQKVEALKLHKKGLLQGLFPIITD